MTANLVAHSRASKEFSLLEEIFLPRARNDRIFLEDSAKDSLIVTSLEQNDEKANFSHFFDFSGFPHCPLFHPTLFQQNDKNLMSIMISPPPPSATYLTPPSQHPPPPSPPPPYFLPPPSIFTWNTQVNWMMFFSHF